MTVQYTITFLGEVHVPETATKEQVNEYIVQKCYERGIDTSIADDIEWNIVS